MHLYLRKNAVLLALISCFSYTVVSVAADPQKKTVRDKIERLCVAQDAVHAYVGSGPVCHGESEEIEISGQITDLNWGCLSDLNPKRLTIEFCSIEKILVSARSRSHKGPQELILKHCSELNQIEVADSEKGLVVDNVQSLTLFGTSIEELPLELFRCMKQLKTLDLSCNGLQRFDAEMLSENQSLETLLLSDNEMRTFESAHVLHNLPRLKMICLSGNDLSPEDQQNVTEACREANPDLDIIF